ncbi:glycosyltransferase [Vibrio breoganii]|uniref:glycosyltransferase n=1 Tax=Vibrio breoganii TaxID=553239 RepID=UPI0024111433|nr:glycosyltransferase [Vibrio breoganii]
MTVHDGLYYLRRESKHKLRFLHYVVEKIVFYKVKRTHFISEFTKSKTLYPVNKTDYSIIPNTTPFEFIKNCNSIPHKQFSSKLNLFTVRGIQERTRIDLLVDLATTVKQSKLDIHIFVAGKGELLDFYKADVCERGLEEYITFLGYVSDLEVASYYASCDLVIVPAEYGEGFGLPIIEGYCFDKPVIASNVCAIPEVIIDKEHLFNNNTSSIFRLIDSFYRSSKNNSERVYIDYYKENFAESVIHKLYNEEIYR